MKWTEEEQQLVTLYGLCKTCGAPRKAVERWTDTDGYFELVCTADEEHK